MRSRKVVFGILRGTISILLVLLLLIGIAKAGESAYEIGYRIFTEPAMEEEPGHDKRVYVEEDMSEIALGRQLEEKGLVDSGMLFALQLRLSAYHGKIKAGDYLLNTSQEATEMMQAMAGEEDSEEGDTDEADSEEGDTDEADSEEGDTDEAGSEEGDSDEAGSEEGDLQ